MSRWFPDEFVIELTPDRVVVERRAGGFSLARGNKSASERRVLDIGIDPGPDPDPDPGPGPAPSPVSGPLLVAGSGFAAWHGAVRALAAELDAHDEWSGRATVVLGGSLVRYTLVPQSKHLSAEQEAAVLQHCFSEIYGDVAAGWELRLSAAPGFPLQPASGVDRRLIDALRSLFEGRAVRLQSIQPRLMNVCNQHRRALNVDAAWLLLVEPGNLCLGLIAGGGLTRLRSQRCKETWLADLPWLIEREACLAELDETPVDLVVWTCDDCASAPSAAGDLRLQWLPMPRPADAAVDDALPVMAG